MLRRDKLQHLIEAAHTCYENTCEVCASVRNRLYLHAAWLLLRPSQAPLTEDDRLLNAFKELCPLYGDDPAAIDESNTFLEIPWLRCGACDTYVFTDQGPQHKCDACGARFTLAIEDATVLAIALDVLAHEGR